MWRYMVGGVAVLMMLAAGVVLFRSRASADAPTTLLPAQPGATAQADDPLPDQAPQATDRTREQKRFDRYDKDRNGGVTREEYLMQRRKAFAKLDVNHDGQLAFDEWAIKAETKFATADRDKSGVMNTTEFATTAVKRKPSLRAKCAPTAAPTVSDDG